MLELTMHVKTFLVRRRAGDWRTHAILEDGVCFRSYTYSEKRRLVRLADVNEFKGISLASLFMYHKFGIGPTVTTYETADQDVYVLSRDGYKHFYSERVISESEVRVLEYHL